MKGVRFFVLSPVFLVVGLVGIGLGAWEVRHGLVRLAKEKFNRTIRSKHY